MERKKYVLLVTLVFLVGASVFIFKRMNTDIPEILPSSDRVTVNGDTSLPKAPENKKESLPDLPLNLPAGFSITYFSKDLSGPRVLAFDPRGHLVASLTKSGEVIVFIDRGDGGVEKKVLLSGLSEPHGLLFMNVDGGEWLYVAETNRVMRYDYDVDGLHATNPLMIADLPTGGRHTTRTLLALPDSTILVSVGSSCDVCIEKTNRGMVLSMNPDGTDLKPYATGLRNSVFMRTNPKSGEVWATEMGRDFLGDDLPPDEINIVKQGNFYGWPYCYGRSVLDATFNNTERSKNLCASSTPSLIDIPAHSAPLGLAFIPDVWQKIYGGGLLVAYHGSWNRSERTGYKIVRMKFDSDGNYLSSEDFISGWTTDARVLGRPADLLFRPEDGVLFISDDQRGAIYKVAPY